MNFDIANINNSISWIPRIYRNFNHCFLMYFKLRSLESLDIFFKRFACPLRITIWQSLTNLPIYIKVFVLKVLMIISCSNLTINNWWLLEVIINVCKQKNTMWIKTSLHLFKSSDLSRFSLSFRVMRQGLTIYIFFKTLYVISLGIDRMANYVYMRTKCALCRS